MTSTTATVITTALIATSCAGLGYFVARSSNKPEPNSTETLFNSEEDDPEGIPDGDLSTIKAGFLEPCKLILVVRTDLKLSDVDVSTHCASATLACYKALLRKNSPLVKHWERTGQAKIALRAKSEVQLLELEAVAKSLNLCARSVPYQNDPSRGKAVLGIGPAPVNLVNEVTGKLKLF